MPSINPGESRNSYVGRCVKYVMDKEGLKQEQAVGKCEGLYDQHLKKSKAATQEWASTFLGEAAKLDAEKRNNLSSEEFAYIDENGGKHLPINDAAHVRNALARFNQTSIPEDKKAAVKAKILRAAHKFGIETSEK